MSIQRAVAEQWKAVTGNSVIEAYGLTEASPGVTANPLDSADSAAQSDCPCQTPISLSAAMTAALPVRGGRLCVRPAGMKGYWKHPEETAEVVTADGFLRTGDIAVMDPRGFIRIVDRKKDMILFPVSTFIRTRLRRSSAGIPACWKSAVGVPMKPR